MPTYGQRRIGYLHCLVDRSVGLAETVGPEHFPRSQFGISQQESPELNIVAIDRALAAARRANEFFQFQKSLPGAIDIDAAGFGSALTEFAEAGDISGIDRGHVMRGSQALGQRALALGSPHNSVYVVRTRIVLDQTGQEIS